MMKKKIAIFGGTFNPIHLGHIRLATAFQESIGFDKILLIPTKIPPHKQAPDLVAETHRYQMCRLAVQEHSRFEVSDIELKRTTKSYTYDTLTELQKIYPDAELFLIMGSDMFLTFTEWYRAEEMLSMVTLLTAARNPEETEALAQCKRELERRGGKAFVLDIAPMVISSTEVREQIKAGKMPTDCLDERVLRYIREHDLYHPSGKERVVRMDENAALQLLSQRLKPQRLEHSIKVAERAAYLAERYQYDKGVAKMTGLLHDICKNDNFEIMLQTIENSGIILTAVERQSPPLYHAIAGAAYVKDVLRVDNDAMLQAIRYHTTGRAGMSLLEKIVFIADLTSEDRCYPDVEYLRNLSEQSLEAAMLFAMGFLLRDLVSRKQLLHPDSVACYNELRMWDNLQNHG